MNDKALRPMEEFPLQYLNQNPFAAFSVPTFRTRLDGKWYRHDQARSLPS